MAHDPFNIAHRLQEKWAQNLYRERRIVASPQQAVLECDQQSLINFCSNDYLGLANHTAIVKAFKHAANEWGVGSGASHLVTGHSQVHHQLEEALAEWIGLPRALLFSTGYMANLGVISALCERSDVILQDKLNHASLLDGALLSRADLQRYRHNDLAHLQQRLESTSSATVSRRTLVVTDSVFSMDGDIAPLSAIAELCQQHQSYLMVDDAHGLGVLGQGKGILTELGLGLDQVPVYMGTLGKALGTFGAFVAGSSDLIEFLIQFARPYIYTTAMPPAVAAATLASLSVLQEEPWRVERLHNAIAEFKSGAAKRDLPLMPSVTAIQPLLIGDAKQAMQASQWLQKRGCLISAIRPPTVLQNSARLRLTLTAEHSTQQIQSVLDALAECPYLTDLPSH